MLKECPQCKSKKLILFNRRSFDHVIELRNDQWTFVDPRIQDLPVFSSVPYLLKCGNCHHLEEIDIYEYQIFSPNLKEYKEVTLDLDQTVIKSISNSLWYPKGAFEEYSKEDFHFELQEYKEKYKTRIRPYFKELLEYLEENFEKINIYTAATEEYANNIIKHLNINKLGYIKTRKDCFTDRCLSFDRESMKSIDNQIILEDKPLGIHGSNNAIFKVEAYNLYNEKDIELNNLLTFLKNYEGQREISIKKEIPIEIEFRCRNIKISGLIKTEQLMSNINLKHKLAVQEFKECKYFHDKKTTPLIFRIINNEAYAYISHVQYKTYVKMCKVINCEIMSEKEWNSALTNLLPQN